MKVRFKASTVWVGTRSGVEVYRSIHHMPPKVRTRMKRAIDSDQAYTILIADKNGREELVKTLGETHRSEAPPSPPRPFDLRREAVLFALIGVLAIAVLVLLLQ